MYHHDAGIKNGKFLNEEAYKKEWETTFVKNAEEFQKKDPSFKYSNEEKNEALEFDLLCYKTILCYVYK